MGALKRKKYIGLLVCSCLLMGFFYVTPLTLAYDFKKIPRDEERLRAVPKDDDRFRTIPGDPEAKFRRIPGYENPDEEEGNVQNLYGRPIGGVDVRGNITNRFGRPVGSVDVTGTVYNVSDLVIGWVERDGAVYNQAGTFLGSVDYEGNVYNREGRKIGAVQASEYIVLMGGAARVLLLAPRRN